MTSLAKPDRPKRSKRTSLASAASQSNSSLVQELINEGEKVNGHDSDGFTALHRACAIGDDVVVQVLLTNKADPNIADSCGDTSLHWACFCGHVSTVTLLLENGADPNCPSSDGKTALDAARDEGHTGIVRALTNWLDRSKEDLPASTSGKGGAAGRDRTLSRQDSLKSMKVFKHAAGNITTGMDFIVEIEGSLKKRSKNKVLGTKIWRNRYFMVSDHFCGLFVWLGEKKTTIDKDVKFFPYELFYKCGRATESKSTKRFNLSLTNGRNFCLQAETSMKCEEWILQLNKCGGRNMAVLRLQQCWRHYHARAMFSKAIAKAKEKRNQGVRLIQRQKRLSTDTSITRGPLKKKDYHGSTEVTKMWRNRYFVIDHQKGELRYYDNRTKEKIGYRPRTVKFHQLLSVNYHKKRNGGRQFTVRVTNGRTYELSASKRLLASQWVQSLLQLLPAENVAALKVQANWRTLVQYKKFNKIIKEKVALKKKEKEELKKQQLKDIKNKKANEQAAARSHRLNRLKKVKAEREAQQKLANAKLAESGESKKEKEKKPKLSRMARLKAAKAAKAKRMEEKKKAKEDADQKAKEASEAAAKAMNEENNETPTHFWTEYETEEGDKYYHNSETGETVWKKPVEMMTPEEKLEAANQASLAAAMQDEEDASDSDDDADDGSDGNPSDNWRNWSIVIDEASGREYYVNAIASETRWVCPTCMLKDNWNSAKDDQERVYYYSGQETSWQPPYREECDPLLQPGKLYSEQETYVFTVMVSQLLNIEMDLQNDPSKLYRICKSGLILGRLMNVIAPDTLDERALSGIQIDSADDDQDDDATTSNLTVDELSNIVITTEKCVDNHKLCMNSLNTLGISVSNDAINAGHMALADPHCINEFLYLLLRYHSQLTLDPSKNKNVFALAKDVEDRDEIGRMRTMEGTAVLQLWIQHMSNTSTPLLFHNVQEGYETMTVPEKHYIDIETTKNVLLNVTNKQYGDAVSDTLEGTLAEQSVCNWFYEDSHLKEGRVMEIVCSLMFANCSTLLLPEVEQATMMDDNEDEELSREGRTYKTWITSLLHNIEGSKNIRDLVEDLRDGELLIQLIALITMSINKNNAKINQGESKETKADVKPPLVIDWKRVNKKTTSRFKQVENVNYLLELCKTIGLNLTNIGSLDIIDRNPKILNALLYRLLRFHSLSIVAEATGVDARSLKDVDEKVVVNWVNEKLASSEEGGSIMKSFREPENKNSVLFMELLEAMRPGIVNWEIMRGIESREDLMHNAKYVISVARKMGATVFIAWEDIVEVNKNMLVTFVCELMALDKGKKKRDMLYLKDMSKEKSIKKGGMYG